MNIDTESSSVLACPQCPALPLRGGGDFNTDL